MMPSEKRIDKTMCDLGVDRRTAEACIGVREAQRAAIRMIERGLSRVAANACRAPIRSPARSQPVLHPLRHASRASGGYFPLPAPAEQAESAEAGGEEREGPW